jgi:hypothetical protein
MSKAWYDLVLPWSIVFQIVAMSMYLGLYCQDTVYSGSDELSTKLQLTTDWISLQCRP